MAQNLGNKDPKRAKEGFKHGTQLLLSYGLIISVSVYIFCPQLLKIFLSNSDTTALNAGVEYFRIMAFFYILCFIGNSFVGYFRGIRNLKVPFIGTTLQISIRVFLSYFLVSKLGLNGVAISTGVGWLFIVGSQILFYYLSKKRLTLDFNYNKTA